MILLKNDTNKLIKNGISSNWRITSIEDNNNLNIFTESEELETQGKHINRKGSIFDLHYLVKLLKDYENNPIIGYLGINHLSNKIDYLREICSKSPIDILRIDETKLDSSYSDAQLEMPGY